MLESLLDALIDTLKMIPFLLFIYIAIEVIEIKYSEKIHTRVKSAGKSGVFFGALFGCVPQCGFSIISTALYTKKLITVGTLLAVYLSTSDEAIPVILSQPDKVGVILPLLLTKVVIAVAAGYSVDFVLRRIKHNASSNELSATAEDSYMNEASRPDCPGTSETCSCHATTGGRLDVKKVLLNPAVHTIKVSSFIFLVTLFLNLIISYVGEENLGNILLANSILQPVVTGLIGLIPNCAASVAITEVFLKGGISFGSTIAGLSAGAGLGIIVLFKESRDFRDSFRIVGLLYAISVTVGILIQYFYG